MREKTNTIKIQKIKSLNNPKDFKRIAIVPALGKYIQQALINDERKKN